jgi:competence protein ComEC
MCDVGQGDATLARSEGLVMLIDTGPEADRLAECLGELGIGRIDLLVLTHFDLDHVGGSAAIVGRVDRVLVGPSSGAPDDRLVAQLAAAGAEVSRAHPGDGMEFGHWRYRVLWPDSHAEPGNPASVTIALDPLDASARSAILLGDLGEEPQDAMTRLSRPGHVDVVKVSHHGSADQSAALYDRLDAAVGLIGVGADNDYGHPTDRALGILAAAGTAAYRTDTQGMILVSPRQDGGIAVWTER